MRTEGRCEHCGFWNDGFDCEGEVCAECAAGRSICHGCGREPESRKRPVLDWFVVVFVLVVLLALLA
ncbi:MAG: hypothetical protein VKP62_16750 [Candidatus Sericytochromatia bacterium]|nr:hypothetical protein [Candidatus Sericytochromatia bacterium]